ncbi:DNA polymerase IV, partial [Candidatus Micrarchaeota archaeon]|nr:DNA polymerase IV [Candidatus Micrarchaeota archaeon]
CRTVGINAVDINMRAHTKSKTLMHPSGDFEIVWKAVLELYSELLGETWLPFRRVGVRVERFESVKGQKKLGEF